MLGNLSIPNTIITLVALAVLISAIVLFVRSRRRQKIKRGLQHKESAPTLRGSTSSS